MQDCSDKCENSFSAALELYERLDYNLRLIESVDSTYLNSILNEICFSYHHVLKIESNVGQMYDEQIKAIEHLRNAYQKSMESLIDCLVDNLARKMRLYSKYLIFRDGTNGQKWLTDTQNALLKAYEYRTNVSKTSAMSMSDFNKTVELLLPCWNYVKSRDTYLSERIRYRRFRLRMMVMITILSSIMYAILASIVLILWRGGR